MAQQTFSDMEYSNRKRKTNREKFLDIMEEIIPCGQIFRVAKRRDCPVFAFH